MDFALTPDQEALRARAARFIDDVCIPLELTAEQSGGKVSPDDQRRIVEAAIAAGIVGAGHLREHGGAQLSMVEQVIVQEELGRNTNALWWLAPGAYNVLGLGTPDQIDRYLRPALRGELADAYAVTERNAGSDASAVEGTATRQADGTYRIVAEKWFVTTGDVADVYIVMVNVVEGDARLPTLFLVDRATPGITFLDDPPFTHTYPHGHPTIAFDCSVSEEAVLGGPGNVGRGNELQNMWFVEERIHIAARCVGAMRRLLAESVEWTTGRVQGGARLWDHQGISFPLADSAADCAAARLLTYHVAQLMDDGADGKLVHGKAAMAKLFCSEAANRCADRAVQAFGGRGYMRTTAAERFWRELRVDRIWEGTSEIQRLITARGLERRGVERMLSL
jgi:alkylation response protein AidB-like acyl-CoA dehydrogenase